jgi:hypothetical protein
MRSAVDVLFPFGFPQPTAWYLTLYVAVFALHQALVHYVVAGSLYVAWATLFPGASDSPRASQPLAATLRDWMPFALGAAITAGVAPLLIVQLLYPRGFYTANLLLAWRWMVVVPVLALAFYLCYLLKSALLVRWPLWARRAVALAAAISFVFVGFCWSANHLLASQEASWPEVYASGELPLSILEVAARLTIWIGGAFATLAVMAGWQLELSQGPHVETRRLTLLTLSGLSLAVLAGLAYMWQSNTLSGAVWSRLAFPYFLVALLGGALQAGGWTWLHFSGRRRRAALALASVGCVLGLLSVSVLREALRLNSINIEALFANHAAAAEIGGLSVFLLFAVINFGLIGGCFWLVRRALVQPTREEAAPTPQTKTSPESVIV